MKYRLFRWIKSGKSYLVDATLEIYTEWQCASREFSVKQANELIDTDCSLQFEKV